MSRASGNPFRMPTDEEVFVLRDEEKRQKAAERERVRTQHIHEKTTWAARVGNASGGASPLRDGGDDSAAAAAAGGLTHVDSELHLPTIDVREKDNMAIYIQKKREMGLARMSLATKRQEIRKLDEEADRAEKRLRQQEEQLASTNDKFHNFLKHSSLEQDAAVKRADRETKEKQEKLVEIKKLSSQIAQVEADKKKNEEQLEQCLGFKRFLDDLTPAAWFVETVIALKIEDERQRILHQLEAQFTEAAAAAGTDGAGDDDQEARQEQLMMLLEQRVADASAAIRRAVTAQSIDITKAELDAFNPARVPMFFTEPNQILEQFVDIEEKNLALIQHCQELEEEIETVTQQYQQEQQEMAAFSASRRAQMEAVTNRIHVEQAKLVALKERLERVQLGDLVTVGGAAASAAATAAAAAAAAGGGAGHGAAAGGDKNAEVRVMTQEELKTRIEDKIKAIFSTIKDEGNMDSLAMLTQIETRLEQLHQTIHKGVDEGFAATVMKLREKDRRRLARQQMLNRQAEEREERSRKALERSQAPVVKRVGKPVMWRSRPLDKKKKENVVTTETTGNEDDEFFM